MLKQECCIECKRRQGIAWTDDDDHNWNEVGVVMCPNRSLVFRHESCRNAPRRVKARNPIIPADCEGEGVSWLIHQ